MRKHYSQTLRFLLRMDKVSKSITALTACYCLKSYCFPSLVLVIISFFIHHTSSIMPSSVENRSFSFSLQRRSTFLSRLLLVRLSCPWICLQSSFAINVLFIICLSNTILFLYRSYKHMLGHRFFHERSPSSFHLSKRKNTK